MQRQELAMQRDELRMQREAIEESKGELSRQADAQQRQNELLERQNRLTSLSHLLERSKIRINSVHELSKKSPTSQLDELAALIQDEHERFEKAFNDFYKENS